MSRASDLLKHKKLFDQFAAQKPHSLSAYHFSSIFLWHEFFDFTFEVIDGHLCVFAAHELGVFLYLPPLSKKLDPAVTEKCFKKLALLNHKKGVARIENVLEDDLPAFGETRRKTARSPEYCYVREDIVGLKGNAYKSKRSGYNQFVKAVSHEFAPFDRKWSRDCLKLYDAWAANRAARSTDDVYKAMLEENRGVHELIFQYADELGLEGRVVLIKGKPQAYTFGYSLNTDIFCVLVEITNIDIKGLSVYIFSRFCADDALKSFKFINAMDDFAMDNVAKTKGSFRPSFLVHSYTVTEK